VTLSPTASISIVIPAHNEEANVEAVVTASLRVLRDIASDFEVIVVDDASNDGTIAIARRLEKEHPGLRVLQSARNLGANGAIRMGMTQARCELIFFIPADLQVRPDQLIVCLHALRDAKADYVCTDRVQRADRLHRRLMSQSYNLAVRTLFGLRVHDVDSSFLIRRDVFDAISGDLGDDTDFLPVEMLVLAASHGYVVTEVGVEHHARAGGQPTSINPRSVLRTLATMVRSIVRLRRLRRETLRRAARHMGEQDNRSETGRN
jgi:glycosyltransferase involved in cell wall biosynthesis